MTCKTYKMELWLKSISQMSNIISFSCVIASMKGEGNSQPLLLKKPCFNNNSWHNGKSSCCTGWNHSFEKEMMSCNLVFQADTSGTIRSSRANVFVHLNNAVNQHNSNLWLHFPTIFLFIFVLYVIMPALCSSIVLFMHMMNYLAKWMLTNFIQQ